MAIAGSLTYDTRIDKDGFEKGIKRIQNSVKNGGTKIKNIVSALGITKLISTAVGVINSSIDGAVSRIDTLNNFPKVMSNLGIASEESTKAINKLSDGLQGIPTTLDAGALAVQRFTSKNGDVNKSVDLFLAVNNALLAGGASADIQSSAMEQLSQSYAKGKPDMIEWRSIQTAMPAQLKQISKAMLGNKDSLDKYLKKAKEYATNNPLSSTAKELVEQLEQVKAGSGDMTTALGTALRTGIISMDEFMDTIVKMNQEGSGEFKSFAEQAKNATGGIKTSITNAKTAITRGVANIIKAFDEMLASNGLGGLSGVINKIGKTAEKVLKEIAVKMKDAFNWIVKHQNAIKTLVKVVASLTAGYIAYKTTLTAIKAINIVSNTIKTVSAFLSLIPAVKSAGDAMALFNLACSSNIIGLTVAAVAALAAGLAFLATRQTEAQKEAKKFAEEMANSRKEMEDYRKNVDENTYANLSHVESVKGLRKELDQLVDENGKVKEGYKGRVDFILKELNEALGTEYKLNGDIVESYKDLQKEIDLTIDKKKAQIILQGEEEKYKNAIENQKQAVEDLKTAEEKLGMSYDEAKKRCENYYNAKRKLYGDDIWGNNQGGELTEEEHNAFYNYKEKEIEALKELVSGYEDAESKVKTYTDSTKKYAELYALYTEGKYEEVANTIIVTTEDWTSKTLNELNGSITEQSKALNIYKDIYAKTGNEVAKQNAEQAQKNLDDLVAELAVRTSTLGELGQEEIEAWKNIAEQSYSSYSTEISKMPPEMQQKIQEATGIIAAGTPQMQEKAEELGRMTVDEFDKSADAKTKALNTITGYLQGLSDEQKREFLRQAGIENVDAVLDELNRGDLSETNGRNILEGLWKGLKNNTWQGKILGVASGLAQAVNKAFTGKNGWDEHSPSKKMKKFAEYYIQPISDVMNKRKKEITNTAEQLASSINDSIAKQMNADIIQKMQNAVLVEVDSINAKASLQSNQNQPTIIARDTQTTINNTQNFYDKQATPYEQQRQAKEQMRRLAYGL